MSGIHLGSSVCGGGGGRYQIMHEHSGSLFEKRREEGDCDRLRVENFLRLDNEMFVMFAFLCISILEYR